MATVIPVRFAYAARDLWFDPGQTGAVEGDHVICSTERGTEIGLATEDPFEVSGADLGRKTNSALKPVLRVASEGDFVRAEDLARKGEEAMPTFRRLVKESELDMKPVGVEYLFGRERVVCYFAADERVDFRQLVRSLSHELHERIDMRQIGVREEAAVVGGFGHCGQELCCARIGLSFEPVSIRMAKEQDLPLTSNKISGACGRLMCCLRYEFEAYRDFKSRAPKRNAVIDTPLGKAKIVEYDTPKEQLVLRIENGKTVCIPLGEMVTSDAAVKKSEELHCPCRPDTVLRSSLDKLSSPDVQMALAELDRKMGVVKDEEYETEDLFAETKPRKRRRRSGGSNGSGRSEAQEPAVEKQQAEASGNARRRRRRRSGAQSTETSERLAPKALPTRDDVVSQEEGQSKRRRRRRSGATQGQDAAGTQGVETQSGSAQANAARDRSLQGSGSDGQPKESGGTSRRRRRHRSSSANTQAQGQGQGQSQSKGQGQSQGQSTQPKPRRRPGDKGGQSAQQQRTASQATGEGQTTDAPKRRRRRRGGRGRGGSGGAANVEATS